MCDICNKNCKVLTSLISFVFTSTLYFLTELRRGNMLGRANIFPRCGWENKDLRYKMVNVVVTTMNVACKPGIVAESRLSFVEDLALGA